MNKKTDDAPKGFTPPDNAVKREHTLSEFMKFAKIGQAAVGKVAGYRENKNGPFIEMAPVVLYKASGEAKGFANIAIGLTSALRTRIVAGDVGRWFGIRYSANQETSQPQPLKLFDVFELTREQAAEYFKNAGASDLMPLAASSGPLGDEFPTDMRDDEGLPF